MLTIKDMLVRIVALDESQQLIKYYQYPVLTKDENVKI